MAIIIAVLVFAGAAAAAAFCARVYFREKEKRALRGDLAPGPGADVRAYFGVINRAVIKFNSRFAPAAMYKKTAFKLKKINAEGAVSVERFIYFQELCALCAFALIFAAAGDVLTALCAAGASFFLPVIVLNSKARKKEEELLAEMPDAVDLIASSIEGGLSLQFALARYTGRNRNCFSGELEAAVKKTRLGLSFEQALRELDAKFELPELSGFVNAFTQADKMGGNVKEIIKAQAEEIRNKRFQELKRRAYKAPVKLLIPLLLFIFPVIFIVLFGPVFIKLSGGF